MKKLLKSLLAVVLMSGPVHATADILVNTFGGLNTQDSPAAIQPYEAQDLLNVNLQPGMKAVFKRDGYGLFQTLPISCSTCAVHGGYHFQQAGGNDVQLWGNDTELTASVNDANFVKLATGTAGATWQCTDNLGFAYCLTSANDTAVKTDGSVANTTYQDGTIPKGSIVASTPLQLIVAGVPNSVSTINFSANNNFTNFVTGPLPTDPYIEIINAPGSRITHLAYYFGKVFWWKDQSFGYLSGTANQGTVNVTIVSNQIGTLDNSSAFWNGNTFEGQNNFTSGASPNGQMLGGIFFRGQDNHIYVYDGYSLTRITRVITPTITSSNRKKANVWVQTSQSDFQAGASSPTPNLSFTISPNDVIVSSFQTIENSSITWSLGTTSNIVVGISSMSISVNNTGNVTNPDFESAFAGNWYGDSLGATVCSRQTSMVSGTCTFSPNTGSAFLGCGSIGTLTALPVFQMIDTSSNVITEFGQNLANFGSCGWHNAAFTSTADIGKRVRFRIKLQSATCAPQCYFSTVDSYIFGGQILMSYGSGTSGGNFWAFDTLSLGSSTITSGSFTSQPYNTGFTSTTYQINQIQYIANNSTPTFDLQTATGTNGPWRELVTSTITNGVGNQYVRFTSTITIGSGDNAFIALSSWTILSRSTGSYFSAVNNSPNLTSWSTLGITDSVIGNSTITYYTRSATGTFTVGSATPTWTIQSKNAQVSASTGTFFQLRADFAITAATETPTLNDFTFNWFEGSASDKAYIAYFQDSIWVSESSGTATSTSNVIYRLDLLNNAWLQDNIASNGFLVENNQLYFGDPITGKVYRFGGVTTDNGLNIRSYWKSKDFTGIDPTVQNEYTQADFTFAEALSTATYTYNIDQGRSTTAVLLPLFDSGASIIKRGLLLANGKIGTFYNFQVGDNSSNAKWTLLFHRVHYNALNWIPQTR